MAIVGQLSSGELSHRRDGFVQPFIIKVGIKENQVCVGGHDNKGIDAQAFMLVAIVETFGQDEAWFSRENTGSQ